MMPSSSSSSFGYPQSYAAPARPPQSGMGIASFVIALCSAAGIVMLIAFIVSMVNAAGPVGGRSRAHDQEVMNLTCGVWMVAIGVLTLVGIVFGIGGIMQRDRRRGFAVTGLVLNVALPIGILFLMLTAATMEGASGSTHRRPPTHSPAYHAGYPAAVAKENRQDAAAAKLRALPWPSIAGGVVTVAAFVLLRLCFREPSGDTVVPRRRAVVPPPLPAWARRF